MQLLPNQVPDKIGLVGHTIINYPSLDESLAIIDILVKNGVSLIELQIPFSEPIADGPLFTKANHEAIVNGITLADCYQFIAHVCKKYPIPFVIMTYANLVVKQGYETFVKKAIEVGAKGAIVPDFPLDVASDYLQICQSYNFSAIPVVAPNITEQRLQTISPFFDGFVYAAARFGVTGSKTNLSSSLSNYLQKIRQYSSLPIAVGFGIATPADLAFLKGKADYAVIGSETLRVYQDQGLVGVENLWRELSGCR